MPPCSRPRLRRRSTAGFTYLTMLFAVALIGLSLALTGEVWHTTVMRDKEAQLLYVGGQYRRAIERYYSSGPAQFPRALEDLLKDTRQARVERYLRRLYPDPITGKAEWGLVRTSAGQIMGVYSLSNDKPFRTAGFSTGDEFSRATKYSDWKFVYDPLRQKPAGP